MKTKPICKVYDNGTKVWWLNDKRHREDGPAVEHADGSKVWYCNDKCHKTDGPAVEFADGDKRWYLNGHHYLDEKDYWRELYKRKKITKTELFLKLL